MYIIYIYIYIHSSYCMYVEIVEPCRFSERSLLFNSSSIRLHSSSLQLGPAWLRKNCKVAIQDAFENMMKVVAQQEDSPFMFVFLNEENHIVNSTKISICIDVVGKIVSDIRDGAMGKRM